MIESLMIGPSADSGVVGRASAWQVVMRWFLDVRAQIAARGIGARHVANVVPEPIAVHTFPRQLGDFSTKFSTSRNLMLSAVGIMLWVLSTRSCTAQAPMPHEWERWTPAPGVLNSESDEVKTLFRLLRAGSGTDRLEVRRRLMKMGGRAVPILLRELGSGNYLLGCNAALVLGAIKPPSATTALGMVASGHVKGDQVSACIALAEIGDPASAMALEALRLTGRDPRARTAALLALSRLTSDVMQSALSEFTSTPVERIPAALLLAVAIRGDLSGADWVRPLASSSDDRIRRLATLALVEGGTEGDVALLMARTKDEDPSVRASAIAGIWRRGDSRAMMKLVNEGISRDQDAKVRARGALLAVARGGHALVPYLSDPSEYVRACAVIGVLLAGEAVPQGIENSLNDRHADVRLVSIIVASALQIQSALPKFVGLDDRDPEVRDVAILSTVYRRGKGALADLRALAAEKREDRLTARADEVIGWAAFGENMMRRLAAAHLQVRLDDLGVAPSWWSPKALNDAVIEALSLEHALPELIIGNIGQGGDRPRSAPRRVAPELEDVRRHLDWKPFPVRRVASEIPMP